MKQLIIFIFLVSGLSIFAQKPPALEGSGWYNTEESFTLESLQGKVVLLDFWGVWCSPCIKSIPKLKALDDEFSNNQLQIITIHTPKRSENLEAFIKENDYSFVTMVDAVPQGESSPDYYGTTTRKFKVKAFPSYILINAKGEIVGGIRSEVPDKKEISELISGIF